MNSNEYRDPHLLDKIIQFLNLPETKETPAATLWNLGSKLYTNVTRVTNKAFADGVWYDESKARQVLIDYINNPECTKVFNAQHQKIMIIYERLSQLSRGKGTWADGIDIGLLQANEPESKLEDEFLLLLPDIKEMILENVFLPNEPEEQLFEALAPPQKEVAADPKAESYLFIHRKGLINPNNKMLFHIHADEFGSGSELEGGKSRNAVLYLQQYLSKAANLYPRDLLEELENTLDMQFSSDESSGMINNASMEIQKEAKVKSGKEKIGLAFSSNKPLLVMGGWTGNPSGHAIYYEIIPESNTKATFRLYNTGAGIEGEHFSALKGHKLKYHSYTDWKGIDRSKLESAHFLEALYEFDSRLKLNDGKTSTDYSERDIYSGLRALLQPANSESHPNNPVDDNLLMTPQRAGVCSWKSLMAFMRTKMDLNDYKRFKCDIKLQSLLDYVQSHSANVDPVDWRLVKRSHENLSRAIAKLYKARLVGDIYIEKAQADLSLIGEWIKAHAACRYKRPVQQIPSKFENGIEQKDVVNTHAYSEPMVKTTGQDKTAPGHQPLLFTLDALKELDFSQPKLILSQLEKLNGVCEAAWKGGDDVALNKGLSEFVMRLSMNEKFWSEAVNKQQHIAEQLIVQLGKASQLFMKSCFLMPDGHIIFNDRIYFFSKMLYLQEMICHLGFPQWKMVELIERPTKSVFLNYPHPTIQQEMRQIANKSNSHKSFRIDAYRHSAYLEGSIQKCKESLKFIFSKSDEIEGVNFQEYVRKIYPELLSELSKNDRDFNQLPRFAQDARIYASDRLPDWLKAVRDTQIANYQLTKAVVGPISTLERDKHLIPHFHIRDEKDNTEVTISLEGLDSSILSIKEVKESSEKSDLRYSSQYNKISSSVVNKLVQLQDSSLREKDLSIRSPKNMGIDLSTEEFKDFVRIFTNSKLMLIEFLEYLTRHPEKLRDTDYQILFQITLFKLGELEGNLRVRGFENLLSRFLTQQIVNFSEENDIQPAVYLLRIAHQLRLFCPNVPFFQQTVEELKKMIGQKGIDDDAKILIYAELIAQLGSKQTLNEEEITLLVAGSIFIEENRSHSKFPIDNSTLKEVREALPVHAKQIREILEMGSPNHAILNKIVNLLRPHAQHEHIWVKRGSSEQFPFFETTDLTQIIIPFGSQLISAEVQGLLPVKMRQNALFKELFPQIEKGVYRSGNIYSFLDGFGRETLVSLKGDHLVVEQKHGLEWVRFVPSNVFLYEVKGNDDQKEIKSLIGSRYLVQQFQHWQLLSPYFGRSKIYLTDPKTGQRRHQMIVTEISPFFFEKKANAEYSAQMEAIKKENAFYAAHLQEYVNRKSLEKLKEQGKAKEKIVVDPSHSYFEINAVMSEPDQLRLSKSSPLFASFEDPVYIHEWYDQQNHLRLIELPRFRLSFKPNPKDPKQLLCDQYEGYHLNTTDSVKKLGVHHHYILLQKGDQRKILLPSHFIKASKKPEVLLPRYELERNLSREQLEPQNYYSFDVEKSGKLFSKSREANLHLTLILTAAQEYKKAAEYLKRYGRKLSAYTAEEVKILHAIGSLDKMTKDVSGNSTVLQLYANYLLLKNSNSHHKQFNQQNHAGMLQTYNRYLNLYKNVTVFKLQKEEEIYLLKAFLGRSFDPIHYLRLKELDPKAALQIKLPASSSLTDEKAQAKSLQGFKIPDLGMQQDYYFSKLLLTRYHADIELNFLKFYQMARKGSAEDKQRFRDALPFIRSAQQGKQAGMANFFEVVLDNPNAFPEPINHVMLAEQKIRQWKSEVQSISEKLLSSSPVAREIKFKPDLSKGFYLGQESLANTVVKWESRLKSVAGFSDQCKDFFKSIPSEPTQTEQLFALLNSCHNKDPVQNREVDRLLNDLNFYQKEKSHANFSVDEAGISSIKSILAKDKAEDEWTLEHLQHEMLKLANRLPDKPAMRALTQLDRWGKNNRVISLDELIVCFARNDFNSVLNRNPSLNETDLSELTNLAGTYLLHATRQQKSVRAEEILNKLEKCKPSEKSDFINQLADELLSTRQYNPVQRPAYLVFEYLEKIGLREAQVQKLEKFLKGENPNIVMEMIMGSGKSKVLLPLLGLLRADGKTLSMLIVPQPLFESIAQDTQEKLQGFSQSLNSLHFDRHTRFTKERLESIYDELVSIQKNKECLIMTSKSVQCLIIKFIEECSNHFKANKNKELTGELKLMQKILKLLSESGYPIIDEADTVLNILHEVSFSGGEVFSPKPHELEFLSAVFSMLYENPHLKELAKLESDPNPDNNAPVLTEHLYQEKLLVPIAKAVIDLLGNYTFESNRALSEKMHSYIAHLDDAARNHLLHYLCRDKDHIEAAQHYFDSLDQEIQNILALAGEEVAHLLPFTLTKLSDEKYGLDDRSGSPLAIPFSAAKLPNYGSQFSNFHITMNYTFQYYAKKGVTVDLVKEQVALLQEKAMREVVGSGGKLSIKETQAGKAFEKLKGKVNMPFFNFKPGDIDNLTAEINTHSESKRFFVTYIILPQLELFEHKITCNPHNLVSFFSRSDGFTGTLWNGASMHHALKPEPAVGTDAKTLSVLWKNSRDNAITVKEGSLADVLKQLNEQSVAFDMIADAGGYFKEGMNSQLAHQIAASQNKEVVFYNSKGEQAITDGLGEIPLPQSKKLPEERLTFLDQSHTTGADVPQKLDAVGLVTIGRNMLLRDLLQSVWRLRGLEKSQRVRFVISHEVAGIIRQKLELPVGYPIQFETILKFVISNQVSQQGRDNYKALGEGFQNIAQKILLKVLMNEKLTPEAQFQAFVELSSSWIKPAFATSNEMYGHLTTKMDAERVVEIDKVQYETKIKQIFEKLPWLEKIGMTKADCLEEIKTIVRRIVNDLPEKLQVPKRKIEDDQTVEVEREVKTETQREVQLEVQEDNADMDYTIMQLSGSDIRECETFEDAKKMVKKEVSTLPSQKEVVYHFVEFVPVFPLKSYLETDPLYHSYASIFDGVHISINILEFGDIEKKFALLGSHRMDFHHLLVENSKVMLLTQSEAQHYYDHPTYYNLTLGFLDLKKQLKTDELLKIVKVKFLNGESHYSLEELKLLRLWIKQAGVEKMQKLFVETILNGYPKKAARYQNSPLQQVFASVPKS